MLSLRGGGSKLKLNAGRDIFQAACVSCHNELTTPAGEDSPIGYDWRPRFRERRKRRSRIESRWWAEYALVMTREELLQRIWIDPGRCAGKPCIRGHRIWVSLILDLLASGSIMPEILESYPGLIEEDIRACIAYGSEMSRERYVSVPLEPVGP